MVGLKIVEQTALAAVRQNLVVHVVENFRRQDLDLEIRLIVDAVRAGQGSAVLAPQSVVEQPSPFRQASLRGGHFGQMEIAIVPGNHVAGSGDANRRLTVFALDSSNGQNVKKLRMERTAVELK